MVDDPTMSFQEAEELNLPKLVYISFANQIDKFLSEIHTLHEAKESK